MKLFWYVLWGCLAAALLVWPAWFLLRDTRTSSPTPMVNLPRSSLSPRTASRVPAPTPAVFASIPYWDQARAVASFQQHVQLIDYVSLFWYYVADDGSIARYAAAKEDPAIIEFAQTHGVKVFALVANLPDSPDTDWDADLIDTLLNDVDARAAHIQALVALAVEGGFDGINVDYEELEEHQRDSFTVFISELGHALHESHKLLGVAIHPKTSEGNSQETNGSEAQDWVALHPHVDHLYFMTYGEHYEGSDPGPLASPSWISRVLEHAATLQVPPRKIFVGIPLYAAEWRMQRRSYAGADADLLWEDVQKILRDYAATAHIDSDSHTPYVVYERSGQERVLWFEDAQSVAAKVMAARRYGVTQVALWRLGGEDPAVWDVLDWLRPSESD